MIWRNKRSKRKGGKKFVIYSIGILLIILAFGLLGASRLKEPQLVSPVPTKRVISESIVNNKKDKQQEIESLLQAANIPFARVTSSQSSIIVDLGGGENVLLSEENDIGKQVSSLQGILSRLTMEGKKFVLLDLRFSKPIIQLE